MATTSPDAFHDKTTDELLFFTQNPGYYHPDLVALAARELRRRGAVPVAPASLPETLGASQAYDDEYADTPSRRGLWVALGVAALLGGTWVVASKLQQSPPPVAVKTPAEIRKSLELTTAPNSPLPNYDAAVEQCIAEQLKQVPASEKTAAQAMSQYRELGKRFWTAQALSEYIQEKARREPHNSLLPVQVESVRGAWNDWNKAAVYGYSFGPTMADHLDRMRRVAQERQEGLKALSNSLSTGEPTPAAEANQREAEAQDLLAGLVKVSPVSKKPYQAQVRHLNL